MRTQVKHPLFDALIETNPGIRNDADLCRRLNVQPPNLSKMRHNKTPVSDSVRVAIMRTFGWSLRRVDALAPPAPAAEQEEAGQ